MFDVAADESRVRGWKNRGKTYLVYTDGTDKNSILYI